MHKNFMHTQYELR